MRLLLLSALFVGCKSGTAPEETDTDTDTNVETDTDDTDTDVPMPDPLTAPENSGPFTFQEFIDDIPTGLVDSDSNPIELRTRIFVPDTDLGPVAMIFPGFLIEIADYDNYAEHLASHGYTVLTVNLPGGLGDNRRTHAEFAEFVGFALNWLEPESATRLEGIDPYNVYAVGHSLGGKTVMLRATTDQRIRAVVALDPVDSTPFDDPVAYPSVTPELMSQLTIPLALLGETNNDQGCAPAAQNFDAYYQAATGPALKVQDLKANHVSWLDDPDCGPVCNACGPGAADLDPEITKRMTRGVILSFFEHARLQREGARDHFTTLTEHVGSGQVTVESKGGL